MNKVIDYFYLKDIGFLELLFSMYIILCGYSTPISASVLFVIVMDLLAIYRTKGIHHVIYKPLQYFFLFFLIHDVITMIIAPDATFSSINALIGTLIILYSIPIIVNAININKLKGSLNVVAIVSVLGMIYHAGILATGGIPSPLTIPFMPFQFGNEDYSMELFRPTSFFIEPQAYVSFILVPLFISLIDKKYLWSVVLLFSMLLSTSTTGIITSFLIIALYMTSQKIGYAKLILMGVVLFGLYYLLINTTIFTQGVEKLQGTDFSSSVRVSQGLEIVKKMDGSEYLFGASYMTIPGFAINRGLGTMIENNNAFMSTVWFMLLRFGAVGLFLYLYIFIAALKKNRQLRPYIVIYIVTMFSNTDTIGGFFAFSCIVVLVFLFKENQLNTNKNENSAYRVGIR